MASSVSITTTEILDAIQAAQVETKNPDGALTVQEMVQATGYTRRKIEETLARIKAEGRLRRYHVKRERLDGVMRGVPAYAVVPKRKRK